MEAPSIDRGDVVSYGVVSYSFRFSRRADNIVLDQRGLVYIGPSCSLVVGYGIFAFNHRLKNVISIHGCGDHKVSNDNTTDLKCVITIRYMGDHRKSTSAGSDSNYISRNYSVWIHNFFY